MFEIKFFTGFNRLSGIKRNNSCLWKTKEPGRLPGPRGGRVYLARWAARPSTARARCRHGPLGHSPLGTKSLAGRAVPAHVPSPRPKPTGNHRTLSVGSCRSPAAGMRPAPTGDGMTPGRPFCPLSRSGPPVPYRHPPLTYEPPVQCHCKRKAGLFVSWKTCPRRRFYGCCPPRNETRCNFFQWYEPKFDDHVAYLMEALRDKVDFLETELEEKKMKEEGIQIRLGELMKDLNLK